MKAFLLGTDNEGSKGDTTKARLISRLSPEEFWRENERFVDWIRGSWWELGSINSGRHERIERGRFRGGIGVGDSSAKPTHLWAGRLEAGEAAVVKRKRKTVTKYGLASAT